MFFGLYFIKWISDYFNYRFIWTNLHKKLRHGSLTQMISFCTLNLKYRVSFWCFKSVNTNLPRCMYMVKIQNCLYPELVGLFFSIFLMHCTWICLQYNMLHNQLAYNHLLFCFEIIFIKQFHAHWKWHIFPVMDNLFRFYDNISQISYIMWELFTRLNQLLNSHLLKSHWQHPYLEDELSKNSAKMNETL